MTRDELVEAMAKALADTDTIRQPHTNGHIYEASRLAEFMHARCKGVAAAALAAIEAQGLAICPVEATKAMRVAGAKGSGEDSEDVAVGAWDDMIKAGKL